MNGVSEDLISVIVPVYKVEKYLDRCVESIVGQTYENLEIILMDDGSPDSCGAMCDAWAQRDSRIKVVHKKNGGLSDARNAPASKRPRVRGSALSTAMTTLRPICMSACMTW